VADAAANPDPDASPGADSGPGPDEFTALLVGFARELRRTGVTVGTGDVLTYFSALSPLDPSDLVDLYWAGRCALVSRREDIEVYDQVFRWYFLDEEGPGGPLEFALRTVSEAEAPLVVPNVDPGADDEDQEQEEQSLGWLASGVDTLKHRSFASCTPAELAALRRIMKRIRLTPPRRRTRRYRSAASGRSLDVRAMARESMRMHGEPPDLYFRQRKHKLRPLVLILDVSGSMAGYSRHLLQFAHTARHAAAKVEVFCFGTRLTRITRQLQLRRPDTALEQAAQAVVDWDGGTRIGESLDTFIRSYGRSGLARGAVVVICSDGLDRGDPETLANAMERLQRLCYKIVWMNPHVGSRKHSGHARDFVPSTLGMMVAEPHIDLLLSGHDLASLEELAEMLPSLC
jgi:hypothetical protein